MIRRERDRIRISGPLTLDTAREMSGALFGVDVRQDGQQEMLVDLAQVEAVDSSAVSVLLQWSRQARLNNVKIAFINLPPNLQSLAKLYDVATVLPLA
ncbi:MAG: STAS domain-containing protein [Pseudomonadota bacterium]